MALCLKRSWYTLLFRPVNKSFNTADNLSKKIISKSLYDPLIRRFSVEFSRRKSADSGILRDCSQQISWTAYKLLQSAESAMALSFRIIFGSSILWSGITQGRVSKWFTYILLIFLLGFGQRTRIYATVFSIYLRF